MPRVIPIALQQHLNSGATTTCVCVLITPANRAYEAIGVTTLDRDVVIEGAAYRAAVGMTPSA